jgi:hypothetical protein
MPVSLLLLFINIHKPFICFRISKVNKVEVLSKAEYVEAATFCRFCETGTLLSLAEINESLLALSDQSVEPLQINVLDYLSGVNTLILLPLVLIPHFPLLPQRRR